MYKNFDELLELEKLKSNPKTAALIGAEAVHALEAFKVAKGMGAIDFLLFGNKEVVLKKLEELGMADEADKVVDCESPEDASVKAINAVLEGRADFIVKGQLDTKVMMGQLVKSANGFRGNGVAHSIAFCEIETHHKLVAMTDAAILIEPSLEQKQAMIENGVAALRALGWEKPKVAVLSAVEKPNPKIKSSTEARTLQEMFAGREDCIVEGPLAFDLALNEESAKLKGFVSEVAGDADFLIFPDLDAGNMVVKTLTTTGHNRTGSVILGLKAPVVMSSRGATMENKLRGILLAASMA